MTPRQDRPLSPALWAAASGAALMLWEILLTRIFSVVLFADLAHLALAVAMLGITLGALWVALRPQPPDPDDEGLRHRAARLLLLQGLTTLLTAAAALWLPLTHDDARLLSWYERDRIHLDLLRLPTFSLLLLVLPLPAAASGALMGTLLQRPALVARAYAADLGAAALAALAVVPLCGLAAPPDLMLLAAATCMAGAAFAAPTARARGLGAGLALACLLALGVSTQTPVLALRQAAGWSERYVVTTRWTPLARLAIFSGPAEGRGLSGDYLLLDSGSASLIVTRPAQVRELESFVSRGLVHALHPPGGRVAILAAGAGPEAAVAIQHGHTDILAVDLDPQMFELVRAHAPDAPLNPLLQPAVTTVALDARAALAHTDAPFDIIQLVHANLVTATGVLNSAWSPRLLYTREALATYLDHLQSDGTLSITAPEQAEVYQTALAALRDRGAAAPELHILAVETARRDQVVLIKPRPLRDDERAAATAWLAERGLEARPPPPEAATAAVLTDDRPYPDRLGPLLRATGPLPALYQTMLWALLLLGGVLGLVVGGVLWQARAERQPGAAPPLLLAACLGYGYLAIEIILIHRGAVLVGHPTYALVTVLVAMLAGSGAGSALSARGAGLSLPGILALLIGAEAGAVGLLPLLEGALRGAPLLVRALGVGAVVLPLAGAAGCAMPLAMARIGATRPRLVALMWALNGWASVLAASSIVLVARLGGYTLALAVVVAVHALAALLARRLPGAATGAAPG